MAVIEARIGTHLTVNGSLLSREVRGALAEALTIPNPWKPTAMREMLYGAAQMPDYIPLYQEDGWFLKIPRGFIHSFINGCAASGIEIQWIDERVAIERGGSELKHIALDPYQEVACQAFLNHYGGLISSPTGSGKTALALEAINRSRQRSIIVVEKASLGAQWVAEIRDKLGYEAGYIGEGQWVERDITVALRQSLWAARDTIDQRGQEAHLAASPVAYRPFWERWGLFMLDEAHHAPAETLVELVQRFPAFMRGGVSATPDRDPLTFPIAQAIIGPVVHETTFAEAEARLVRPSIRVIDTDFDFPDYHPTRREPVWDEAKGRNVTKTIRNNYGEMMAALIADEKRNLLMASKAFNEALFGHHCLMVSSRKEHLEALREMMARLDGGAPQNGPCPILFTLFGGASGEEAMGIGSAIENALPGQGTILFSTVADEGLNIPRLDRLFLTFPSRKVGSTKQKIGRITRRHPQKDDAIVYDFRDRYMKLLNDQFRERRQQLYNKEGFEIEMPEKVAA